MDRILTAVVAVVGVPIVLLGYIYLGERVLERLPGRPQRWFRPYFWAAPAIGFATVFMIYPLIRTVFLSFRNNANTLWVGWDNYVYFFTFPDTLSSLRNSLLWLVFYSLLSVSFGVLVAILVDRVRYETLAKIAIFLPVPISAVAASIIWKFMYDYNAPGSTQTGTLNAIIGSVGRSPVAWLQTPGINNAALIFVGIWAITGFCMVIISASLKSISPELLEAARIDGAGEFRLVRMIVLPLLWPTIAVVGTSMFIAALKVFDIPYVMTSGAYDTDVIATQMFAQLSHAHWGRAAAVGVVLFLCTVPLLVLNIRRFQQQEAQR